jgi:putative hemin transport protein
VIQIHTGLVDRIVPFGKDGEWINVLDADFNLHLRQTAIASGWVTLKPTRDEHVTSVELYDATGELVVQFFGKRKPGEPELNEWRQLVADLK